MQACTAALAEALAVELARQETHALELSAELAETQTRLSLAEEELAAVKSALATVEGPPRQGDPDGLEEMDADPPLSPQAVVAISKANEHVAELIAGMQRLELEVAALEVELANAKQGAAEAGVSELERTQEGWDVAGLALEDTAALITLRWPRDCVHVSPIMLRNACT